MTKAAEDETKKDDNPPEPKKDDAPPEPKKDGAPETVKVPPVEGKPAKVEPKEGKDTYAEESPQEEGNGLAIVLGLAALLGIGIAAFLYFRSRSAKPGDAAPKS